MCYFRFDATNGRHGACRPIDRELRICRGLSKMTIEILYLTDQMQRWLNGRVARHLEAQAARLKATKGLKYLGVEGPGGLVTLDRKGMPADGENAAVADACYADAQLAKRDRDAVHA
jgi:hypothetical protein